MNRIKPIFIAVKFITVILIFGCINDHKLNHEQERGEIYVSPFKPVLFTDDHTSEGFLAPLNDGRILLIFRLDPGESGDHVGTKGYIAKILYDPQNDKWGEIETVYNSHQYDDRNIHGGVTNDGRIVIFFRRYDGRETEGRYFIFSDDNGNTWTDPQISKAWTDPQVNNIPGIWSTGQMFHNPDTDKYIMLGCRRYITYSEDGTSWEEYNLITDKEDYKLSEIAGAWCGDNKIIALIRDDIREHGHPLVQVESHDNGQTWSEPVPTNIPPKQHWGAAPQLIYDKSRDLLIALNSDRYSRPKEQNSLFINTARPDEVIGNPKGWMLQHELRRPWVSLAFDDNRPLNRVFYGYPSIVPINNKEYLVVFTENATIEKKEQADLYYFRLIFN
jgi:hypothetical protein